MRAAENRIHDTRKYGYHSIRMIYLLDGKLRTLDGQKFRSIAGTK